MKLRRKIGFTLIEILVVVSIISLLSAVILAALNSAREKSRIAGAQKFAASVYHKAGAIDGFYLQFDEGSGTVAKDASGNGADGSITGGAYITDTPSGKGTAFYNMPSSSIIVNSSTIPAAVTPGVGFTAAAWIKTSVLPTNLNGGFIVSYGSSDGLLVSNTGTLRGRLFAGGTLSRIDTNANVVDGKWHHIAMSVNDATKTATLFLDGNIVSQTTYTGDLSLAPVTYSVGGLGASRVNGLIIDDALFFGEPLQ